MVVLIRSKFENLHQKLIFQGISGLVVQNASQIPQITVQAPSFNFTQRIGKTVSEREMDDRCNQKLLVLKIEEKTKSGSGSRVASEFGSNRGAGFTIPPLHGVVGELFGP